MSLAPGFGDVVSRTAEPAETVVVDATTDRETRSPSDVLRLAVAAVVLLLTLLVQWLFGDTLIDLAVSCFAGSTPFRRGSST
jgi:hypothetical protein